MREMVAVIDAVIDSVMGRFFRQNTVGPAITVAVNRFQIECEGRVRKLHVWGDAGASCGGTDFPSV